MVRSILTTVAVAAIAVSSTSAFTSSPISTVRSSSTRPLLAVLDVDNEAEFDKQVSGAGDSLVVIDYSTTWCGPCKVIAPKFDELSDTYSDSIFIKVCMCILILQYPCCDIREYCCNVYLTKYTSIIVS